ncbi:MAG: uroporphyrinogen-III synthase, partial [Acidimicrobiia bacterium]
PVYRTVRAVPADAALERVRAGQVDAITFTSSSTVDNLCDLLGTLPETQPIAVSIGPVTSETARARGLRVDAEATEHTIDGLVATLLSAFGAAGAWRLQAVSATAPGLGVSDGSTSGGAGEGEGGASGGDAGRDAG